MKIIQKRFVKTGIIIFSCFVTAFGRAPEESPAVQPLSVKIVVNEKTGVPQLYINGEYYVPTAFFGNTDIGTNVTEQAVLAANAGIHLHSVIYNLRFDDDYTNENSHAYQKLRNCMNSIISGDPDAKIFLRVTTGAYYNPASTPEDEV